MPIKHKEQIKSAWMHRYKRKIILGILAVLMLSITVTMVLTARTLRIRLFEDGKSKTWELSEVVDSSLRHLMLVRNTGKIQETLEGIGRGGSSITKAFILDRHGRVVYSSNRDEIGMVIDRFTDPSCSVCHTSPGAIPQQTTIMMEGDSGTVLRNVNVLRNDAQCHACHPPDQRINGKLIIDRSVKSTTTLISDIELILALSGVFCLIVLVPLLSKLLSRGVNTYIREVDARSTELAMLYMIVERLSKTIEIEELKQIVIETIVELFDPDEVHVVLPKDATEYAGVIWKKTDRKTERRMGPGADPHREAIIAWLGGDLTEIEVSADRKTTVIPVDKGNIHLALLVIVRHDGSINSYGVNLMKAMGTHIAVAFENAALYRIAITDELTGLYTKRHFRHTIEKKFDLFEHYGEKITLLMIDIDDFKKVNDTYGHPAGDTILKDVADCIMHSTRDQDFDFRYGGEEFAVILPATDAAAGRIVAERIRESIASHAFTAGDRQLSITVSIGVAACPTHARTIRDLVVQSDKALYEAKRTGKNNVIMSREM